MIKKLLSFMGIGGATATPNGKCGSPRIKRNTALPRPARRKRQSGTNRLFRSIKNVET